MEYNDHVYVASCVFTKIYPEISQKIQGYVKERFGMRVIRCCVPKYKLTEFENAMPEWYRGTWRSIPSYEEFEPGETMVSLCHNCAAIFEETRPDVKRKSLWELILEDERFRYPDMKGASAFVQDCWRSFDNVAEQHAVREILHRMNVRTTEMSGEIDFCGISTMRPAPIRNLKLAPVRFVQNAEGRFTQCTDNEQKTAMTTHCKQFGDENVICYCHYCAEGLKLGGANAFHLADLLFGEKSLRPI
jgi:hypothetical protein